MGRSLLLLAISLIAGVCIGYVLGNTVGDRPDDAESADTPDREPEVPDLPLPPPGGDDVDAWLSAIRAPRVAISGEPISGRVVLTTGEPLEGVLITARPRWTGEQTPPDAPLRDRVAGFVRERRYQDAYSREATTGSDGRFVLEGLADAAHWIETLKVGYQVWSRNPGGVRPGAEVTFTAQPITEIEVRVLGPDGREAKTAAVRANRSGQGGGTTLNWTPANRKMTLQPAEYEVRATEGDLGSDAAKVMVMVGRTPPVITLRLEHRPGIRGKVTGQEDATRSVQTVCVLLREGREPRPEQLRSARRRSWSGSTPGGGYSFRDLEPGRYRVAALDGERVLAHADVTVSDRMVVKDLELPGPKPGEFIILRIEGPDGSLLEASQLRTGYESSRGNSSGSGRKSRLADGTYRVMHADVSPDRLAKDGSHYLRVTVKEFGTKRVEYDPGGPPEITVRFETPGTLEVTLVGYRDSEYVDLIDVGLRRLRKRGGWQGEQGRRAEDPEDGRWNFGPVAPGDYEITVRIRTGDHQAVDVATFPFAVQPGKNVKSVVLPRLYALTVLLGDLPEQTRLSLSSLSEGRRGRSSFPAPAEDGKLVFRGLPAGKYVIRTTGRRDDQMTVTLPGPSTVTFKAEIVNALSVRIQDPDGLFARKGFRTGDLIIGINGTEFENLRQMYGQMILASEKGPVKLTVLRGNARREVEIDLSGLFGGEDDGGARIEPASR